jgi:hypothetical protein
MNERKNIISVINILSGPSNNDDENKHTKESLPSPYTEYSQGRAML